ncbi:hypothetical protein [Lutibacter citreus]|uniref:hypothetical protein n=1 Tax=Lutibacter citreus TaxID=2138210 RepID=UPI000DBE23A9|nr:hypothetical protein [Lutibacter citreus]
MNDKDYLKYCLIEIEKKLNWDKPNLWKDRDFIKLSEIISAESNISISSHTLKRLFGKIKYVKSYNPQQATKDALSIFIGFKNWDDFIETRISINSDNSKNKNNPKRYTLSENWLKLVLISVSILVIAFLYMVFISPQAFKINNNFKFDLKDSIGLTPYTISINYNISEINTDSIIVDYNFKNPIRGPRTTKLNKSKFINNFTYQIPGYYQVDLKVDGETINSKKVLALSDGWDSYIMPEKDSQTFWINRKIESHSENGSLYYSPQRIRNNGFNDPVFYVVNRLFKQFEIDGDNFELKARFKNTEDIGGITCYNFNLKLFCTNETNYFSLMENGCSQYSGVKIGEKVINGMDTNLSSFKLDTQNWNLFNVIVKNKKVKIYINNKLIFEYIYNTTNGKIVGIENIFKGCGMLDFIELKDLNKGPIYVYDFSSTP